MDADSSFDAFLKTFAIKTRKAASAADITAMEAEMGHPMPENLKNCYLRADGGTAEGSNSQLEWLPLKEARGYKDVGGCFDSPFGLFPFLLNNDSNPVCVSCTSPLRGHVILVRHDDAPKLMFRSLKEFFRAAVDAVSGPGEDGDEPFLDTSRLRTAFDGDERSPEDRKIARELFAYGQKSPELPKGNQTDVFRYACDLLSPEDTYAFETLMKVDDEYVLDHVIDRLKRLDTPPAQDLLLAHQEDKDAFVQECAVWLQAEGLQASVIAQYGKTTLRIDPGPVWLNMDMWHSERMRSDFKSHFVSRVNAMCRQG